MVELGLTIHPEKCETRKTEFEFFGLKFSTKGVSLTDAKIRAIEKAKEPNTVSELRSFLGLVVLFLTHPKNKSLDAPLWNLFWVSKPQTKLVWLDEHTEALIAIKSCICKKALGYFNKGWETLFEVDASSFGVGAVLSKECQDCKEIQVVEFWSLLLSDIERRFSQVERETLAVVSVFGSTWTVAASLWSRTERQWSSSFATQTQRITFYTFLFATDGLWLCGTPQTRHGKHGWLLNPIGRTDAIGIPKQSFLAEEFVNFVTAVAAPRAIVIGKLIDATRQNWENRYRTCRTSRKSLGLAKRTIQRNLNHFKQTAMSYQCLRTVSSWEGASIFFLS